MAGAALAGAAPAQGVILLSAGGATLSNFAPGATASGSGSLTATDTSASWTLQAQDTGSGAGKLVAAATGCTDSDPQLSNALQVSVTSSLPGVDSAGTVPLSNVNQTVASATSATLAATALNTNYTQAIPSTEVLRSGCVYTITITYTLQ